MATTFLFFATLIVAVAMAVVNGISKTDNFKKHGDSFSVEAESLVFRN
ncbi:MAG: hypothetical protein K5685_06945 [Bacteroidales bacterium]|jgi:hypothetical protein|nr:hypothetical protein [Bacteroidales bacterium]